MELPHDNEARAADQHQSLPDINDQRSARGCPKVHRVSSAMRDYRQVDPRTQVFFRSCAVGIAAGRSHTHKATLVYVVLLAQSTWEQ